MRIAKPDILIAPRQAHGEHSFFVRSHGHLARVNGCRLGGCICGRGEQLRGAHPSRQIELEVVGDTRGLWDRVRLQQLLRNLVVNAIEYGSPDTPIHVLLAGDQNEITLEVKNRGPVIEKANLDQIAPWQSLEQIYNPRPRPDSASSRLTGVGHSFFT